MSEYVAHVLICANSEGAKDLRHCGDKGGSEIRKKFNELIVKHDLISKVTISDTGCTSQHGLCDVPQGAVIIYGPSQSTGGTWYTASPDDVEEIVTEHLINGRIVERIVNKGRGVKFAQK